MQQSPVKHMVKALKQVCPHFQLSVHGACIPYIFVGKGEITRGKRSIYSQPQSSKFFVSLHFVMYGCTYMYIFEMYKLLTSMQGEKKRKRCNECSECKKEDCGSCHTCKDSYMQRYAKIWGQWTQKTMLSI